MLYVDIMIYFVCKMIFITIIVLQSKHPKYINVVKTLQIYWVICCTNLAMPCSFGIPKCVGPFLTPPWQVQPFYDSPGAYITGIYIFLKSIYLFFNLCGYLYVVQPSTNLLNYLTIILRYIILTGMYLYKYYLISI